MRTIRIHPEPQSLAADVSLAAEFLRKGEVIAFPTETVYGLGAKLSDAQALKKIYEIKGRPSDNPLIVHIAELEWIYDLAVDIPKDFFTLQQLFWPGPLTFVLKRNPKVDGTVSAGLPTIAVRMPCHPIALKLLELLQEPIAAPSANLSGRPSPTTAAHVFEDLQGKIPLLIDGGSCEVGIESTVLSLVQEEPLLLRPGSISKEALEKALGKEIAVATRHAVPISPGMKYRHYAPNAKVILFQSEKDFLAHLAGAPKRRMVLARRFAEEHHVLSAKELFAHFRRADAENYDEICILCDAEVQNDLALMNRLQLASK